MLLNFTNTMDSLHTSHRRRKTRRGKKKLAKLSFEPTELEACSTWVCRCQGFDGDDQCSRKSGQDLSTKCLRMSNNNLMSTQVDARKGRKRIRPCNSPQAPPNSNQFLIDDRLADIDMIGKDLFSPVDTLKTGFHHSDNFTQCHREDDQCVVPGSGTVYDAEMCDWKTSPAYSDVDFTYKSFSESDMLTFQEAEFERAFQQAKEDKLAERSKTDLIHDIKTLQETLNFLQKSISGLRPTKCGHSSYLSLEQELLQLQQENKELRKENIELLSR